MQAGGASGCDVRLTTNLLFHSLSDPGGGAEGDQDDQIEQARAGNRAGGRDY
jgi:hypothetical protein